MKEEVEKEILKLHEQREKAKEELHEFAKFVLKNVEIKSNLTPAQG